MKNLARHYAGGGDLTPRGNLPSQPSPTGTRPGRGGKIPLDKIEQQMGETKEGKPIEKKAKGGSVYARGAKVGSASKRADGCAERGLTKGKMV